MSNISDGRLGRGRKRGVRSVPHLAETLVVKETQSLTKVRGVVPVMSSHCAGDVPPGRQSYRKFSYLLKSYLTESSPILFMVK